MQLDPVGARPLCQRMTLRFRIFHLGYAQSIGAWFKSCQESIKSQSSAAAMASDGKLPDATAAAADTPVPPAQPAPVTVAQINPDLRLEKLTNGKTYLRKTSDGSAREISIAVYDAMIGQRFSKRSAPSSGIP